MLFKPLMSGMSRHDDSISLRQMLDHAREAVAFVGGKTRDDLEHERILQLALARLVEVIGEAASRVSDNKQAKHPSIPWRDVINMRHKLIHGYDSIDVAVLWDTVTDDLPKLIIEMERVCDDKTPILRPNSQA